MIRTTSPDQIRHLAQRITAPRRAIEAAFLGAGDRLGNGLALLNRLTIVFDSLTDALQGKEAADARTRLDSICKDVDVLARSFNDEKHHFIQFTTLAKAAAKPIHELVRSAKTMGIVSINAQITSAHLAEDGADLQIFSTDIATLSASAVRTTEALASSYAQMADELARAVRQRACFEITHAGILDGLLRDLAKTLETLDSQRTAALESSRTTSRNSQAIADRIASVVMALQVGDATRQRLEHVEAALEVLAGLAADSGTCPDIASTEMKRAVVRELATLQAHQLAGAAADFDTGLGCARNDLNALAQDASAITARAQDFLGSRSLFGDTPVIAGLGSQLRHAVNTLRSFEHARAEIDRIAYALRSTASTFMKYMEDVRNIESEMRLVSLNATIRCAHLGPRAAGLSVISDQLRELTSETMAAGQAALRHLGDASAVAETFGKSSADEGMGMLGKLENDIRLTLGILEDLGRTTSEALHNLSSDGPEAIAQLEKAAQLLDEQVLEARHLSAIGTFTDPDPAACQDHEPGLTGDGTMAEILQLTLETFYRQYTMKAEREIHEALHQRPG